MNKLHVYVMIMGQIIIVLPTIGVSYLFFYKDDIILTKKKKIIPNIDVSEVKYNNSNKPADVKYVNDFTILCVDNYVDLETN
ncbi:hypothetical protein [Spiroplasma turonicum]|uniref:Uncharacterized protein n=1 Tax=Spiroplasma turonicum TaxID=216946 RepID=A0A0K1P6K3_9MOLU|nr:hypothetical protein [Spiroplasma turonicum]AKU79915.1 hypothetical protein STURON_00669 [Spiroplasma turonicum]ALX70927.1 hypothetical protein STURO_v1c06680 [Spiroplasma turonicum]